MFPFAEERVYRGLLQDVLVQIRRTYGIFAARWRSGSRAPRRHEVALYPDRVARVGFGVAYAEGGILAAFFVHATWNLLQMG